MTQSKSNLNQEYQLSDREKKILSKYFNDGSSDRVFKMLEEFPENPVFKQEAALRYLAKGDSKQAERLLVENIENHKQTRHAAEAYTNLSFLYSEEKKYAASIQAAKQSLKIDPDSIGGLINLGTSYHKNKDSDLAIETLKKALTLAPENLDVVSNLSAIYNDLGYYLEAYDLAKPIIKSGKANNNIIQNYIKICIDLGYAQEAMDWTAEFVKDNQNKYENISSSQFLRCIVPEDKKNIAKLNGYMQAYFERCKLSPTVQERRTPSEKIRIGYISPDIWTHVASHFFDPLLTKYDQSKFEVVLFHHAWFTDKQTDRFYEAVDKVITTQDMSDQELFDAIYAENLDIIIDLAGHTRYNAIHILNNRPAPITASYAIGSGTSTFAPNIDYLFADKIHFDGIDEADHSEKLALLETGFCYKRPIFNANVNELPARKNGYITFGTLTRPVRITSKMIETWSEVLKQTPNSKLILDQKIFKDEKICALYRSKFEAYGIDGNRIQPRYTQKFIDSYHDIDIVLDTFPQNSGTTTFDALWMGCPVISQKGCPPVGQLGASILTHLDLEDLVVDDTAHYIKRATELAQDIDFLIDFRAKVRTKLQHSKLMDRNHFVSQFEDTIAGIVNKGSANTDSISSIIVKANNAFKAGDHALSLQTFKAGLDIDPNHRELLHHFSSTLLYMGKIDAAIACMEKMMALYPDHPQASYVLANLAFAFISKGQFQEAVAICQKAVKLEENNAFAWSNLGTAQAHLSLYQAAYESLKSALAIDNTIVPALTTLCGVCVKLNKFDEGEEIGLQAIAKAPDDSDLLYNFSRICHVKHKALEACKYIQKAIELKPNDPKYINQFSVYIADLGMPDQALDLLSSANIIETAETDILSNLFFVSSACNDYKTENLKDIVTLVQSKLPQSLQLMPNNRPQNAKIRIGYISADFKNHPVNAFMENIYQAHDTEKFELYAYSQVEVETKTTERLKSYFPHWRRIAGLKDGELIGLILQDNIDILIDLTGHTADNRVALLNHRIAPVQASYIIGSGTTTGMPNCDFLIGDKRLFNETVISCIPESLAAMESGYLYKGPHFEGEVTPAPCIKNGYITFGCLSRPVRINDQVIDAWANILKLNPHSKLILDQKMYKHAENVEVYLAKFTNKGIDSSRVEFRGSETDYWKTYQDIDVVLDTFPQNAGTTTFEALWMGCPVITIDGPSPTGLIGKTVMTHIGMADWVASDVADYLTIAKQVCDNLDFVANTRGELRERLKSSPLMNTSTFMQEYESLLCEMFAYKTDNKTAANPVKKTVEI